MLDAFEFSNEELQVNRHGKLSSRQHKLIDEYLGHAKKRWRFALIVGLGSAILLFGIAFLAQPDQFLQSLPYMSVAAAIFLLIFSVFVIVDINKLRHLNARQVQSVEGIAHRITRSLRNGRWTAYYVTVDNVRFQVQREQYEAFQTDMPVRVFFLRYPPTHWILSVDQK
jgi:hypothetical protein